MAADDKSKALEAALAKIQKDFGAGAVMRMGADSVHKVETISTGSLPLDIALGVGGVPRGRIVEIFGPEGSGKTTFCYHVMAETQKAGGVCAFIDAEHAMDPTYAARVGVDVDELLVSQPDNGEQALDIAETLMRSGGVDLIVIDSVAALTPKAELEGEMGDAAVGLHARLMAKACRKLASLANQNGTLVLFTNQIRMKIGVMFGSPETTTGGRALPYACSVRLDIRRIETLKEGTEAVGNRVRVKVVKNKVAPPFRQAEFDITYGEGFNQMGALIDLALDPEVKLVSKAGAFFTFPNGDKAQGKAKACDYLVEHPEVAAELDAAIRAIKMPAQVEAPSEAEAGSDAPADELLGADPTTDFVESLVA